MNEHENDTNRAEAYLAFIRRIDDLAIAQLHVDEANMLREAADARLFDSGKDLEDTMDLADQLLDQLARRKNFSDKSAGILRDLLDAIPVKDMVAA